jgi:hypothetical protein
MQNTTELKILEQSKDWPSYLKFIDWYEKHSNKGEDGENYIGLALQEIYPRATIYNLNQAYRIPPTLYKKYNIRHIDEGKNSRGGDFLVIDGLRAGTFDSKTKENKNKSISGDQIARKFIAYQNLTNLDFFGIASDTLCDLTPKTYKDIPGILYLDRHDLFSYEIFQKIHDRLSNTNQTILSQICSPRGNTPFAGYDADTFVQLALDEQKILIKKYVKKHGLKKCLRILNQWPAGAGKTEIFILLADIVEPYRKGRAVNVISCHNTTVLANNVNRLVQHIHAQDKDAQIIFFFDQDSRLDKTANEQDSKLLRKYCESRHQGIDFKKKLRRHFNGQTWIVTLNQSYTKLYDIIADENNINKDIKIHFQFDDEVHHKVQPYFNDWCTSLFDQRNIISILFGASANEKEIVDKTDYNKVYKQFGISQGVNMTVGKSESTWHSEFKKCTEKMAVGFGWKRQAKVVPFVYDVAKFKTRHDDLFDIITEEGKVPMVNIKGFSRAVPLFWVINADAFLQYKIFAQDRRYTLGTINAWEHGGKFAKFLEFYRDAIIPEYIKEGKLLPNSRMIRRLKKMKILVAESSSYDTADYIRTVEAIPGVWDEATKTYKPNTYTDHDALILHCRLLGEGWSPKGGWIDSNIFIEPAHSKIRIYQINERGSRKTGAGLEYNHLIIASVVNGDDDSIGYNKLNKHLWEVGEALRIGDEIIDETFTFKTFKKPGSGGGGGGTGQDESSDYLIDIGEVRGIQEKWLRDGKMYKNYDLAQTCLEHLKSTITKHQNHAPYVFGEGQFGMTALANNTLWDQVKDNFYDRNAYKRFFLSISKGRHAPSLMDLALECDTMLQNAQGNILKNKPIAEKIISEEIEKIEKDPTTAFMKHKQSISTKVSGNVQKRFEEELDIDFTHHTGVYKGKYADYRWKKVAMWFKLTKETEDA